MQGRKTNKNNVMAAFFVLLSSGVVLVPNSEAEAQGLEVSTVLENMNAEQMNAYLSGIVEGLAYARYEQEGRDADGSMKCIQDWFYYSEGEGVKQIMQAFNRFKTYPATSVVAALVAQKCGD